MKNKIRRLTAFILILTLTFSLSLSIYANETVTDEIVPISNWAIALQDDATEEDIKHYPINPSSKEWKTFTESEQMISACRIDNAILSNMSTEELVSAVLSYPMLVDLYFYNSIETALQQLAKKSDAFYELRQRTDGAEYLLQAYNNRLKSRNSAPLASLTIAILLSDEAFSDSANVAVTVGTDASTYAYYVSIQTPKGTTVQVINRGEEYTSAEISELNEYTKKTYPNATYIASSTTVYNCHNFAWNSNNGQMSYWMNQDSAKVYMSDGSYVSSTISKATHAYYGDEVDHSARGVTASGIYQPTVLSKWGAGPVMMHTINYGPYDSSDVTYWKAG